MRKQSARILGLLLALAMVLTLVPGAAAAQNVPLRGSAIALPNGDFEQGNADYWVLSNLTGSVGVDAYASSNTSNTLNLWASDTDPAEISASYGIELAPGEYSFSFSVPGAAVEFSFVRFSVRIPVKTFSVRIPV